VAVQLLPKVGVLRLRLKVAPSPRLRLPK
jgi:hypothetical protein